ncbi:hypothetical protein GQ55_8G022500 [Panicum hallii var. hallii]|uniref:AAA+ ATPase domain-containing protein n=1 Tax=Panicum hallii var. hallii TaxID=1504633 RepID=A0A2T7CJW5_9POAL|nr:hypothetical protein GQ55_8G022500 [Panicum hallii var. hallii]
MAGVGAGTGAMSSLLGKLTTLLSDEYTLLKSVRKEIVFLERELRSMHALLETLAEMHKLDPLEKDWKDNLRELSYDIEDCIDRFTHRLGNGDAKRGFVKRTVHRLKTLWKRHDIATEIQELKARVMEESKRRGRYEFDNRNPRKPVVEIDPRLATFHDEAKNLVAINGPVNQVIAWLAEESMELKVVPIVGCAGLGKTTLAMEVYRKIGGDYQYRASVSVSRILHLEKLLKDVLSQIHKDEFSKCQTERWGKEQIMRAISQILTGKRYLIVIDDVWREEDWKIIKASFPGNHNGSRIIATTRITNVAKSCCSNSGGQLYQMAHLNSADSERLLLKRIFGPDNACPPHLKDISAKILKKCGGLPLAIVTLASLLANKPPTKDEWERLQDSIGIDSSQNDSLKAMRDILLLSYWDLPQHLKTCLLYLCIYPEDHSIECEELKWKWIAEGFIDKQWGNLDQEAENYLNELANRSMLQLVDTNYDSSIKYCQVHDMVLDLIISLSDEENFATVLNGRVCNSLPSKIRRLSMHSNGQQHKVAIHATARSKLHARSLHVFGEFKQITPLVNFLSLRVLDIREGYSSNSCCFWLEKNQIKNIGSLSQLRYLRLDSSKLKELPEEVGMLRYLETLDLRHCNSDSFTVLPSTMVRLRKLVHLLVHERLMLHSDMFGRMHALEVVSAVSNVDNPMKFAEELGNLTNLRKIYMPCSVALLQAKNGGYAEAFVEILVSSLNELGKYNLKYLHISGSVGENMFRDTCCAFPHLQDLEICTLIERIPKGMASLNNIVRLLIKVRLFDEEDLRLLMGMPSLTHLELTLYHRIGVRKKHTIGSNGFKLLKVLHYEIALSPGTGISFAPGALPALRSLHLSWTARDVMSRHCNGANLGIEHLAGLAQLHVETNCRCATVGEVQAVEASIEKAIALHPNRRTLQAHVRRLGASYIYKDVKERDMESDEDTTGDSDEVHYLLFIIPFHTSCMSPLLVICSSSFPSHLSAGVRE